MVMDADEKKILSILTIGSIRRQLTLWFWFLCDVSDVRAPVYIVQEIINSEEPFFAGHEKHRRCLNCLQAAVSKLLGSGLHGAGTRQLTYVQASKQPDFCESELRVAVVNFAGTSPAV
jgi:hypothetical protein